MSGLGNPVIKWLRLTLIIVSVGTGKPPWGIYWQSFQVVAPIKMIKRARLSVIFTIGAVRQAD